MAGKSGLRPYCAELGQDSVRNRTECLMQLLSAFQDIADFDDIHQAAKRLDAVQAWIRREARMAAAGLVFEDEAESALRITQASA